MRRSPSILEFIDIHGNVARTNREIVAFLRYQRVSRMQWSWELRRVRLLPTNGELVPVVGMRIGGGTALTQTSALVRSQTCLVTHLNKENKS